MNSDYEDKTGLYPEISYLCLKGPSVSQITLHCCKPILQNPRITQSTCSVLFFGMYFFIEPCVCFLFVATNADIFMGLS